MGAVLGGRATVGKNCHIGAGTVLAGVIEPPSAQPVIIEDDVVIGANAVVLEGVVLEKVLLWQLELSLFMMLNHIRLLAVYQQKF